MHLDAQCVHHRNVCQMECPFQDWKDNVEEGSMLECLMNMPEVFHWFQALKLET